MAKDKPIKTNAMRLLDRAAVPYKVLTYDYDDEDFDGRTVAKKTGLDASVVYKTLVTRSPKGQIVVCCISVEKLLDLKALAAASGNKSLEMIPVSEILGLTGYVRGGCSPLGMKKQYPTYLDAEAATHPHIAVSAGLRGAQILLTPDDLIRMTNATLGAFATEREQ
jgi:Cys-tRNA(Pro)/Cys-tRNA(Cys) deacylase